MFEIVSLLIAGAVLVYVYQSKENERYRQDNDRPYSGPVYPGPGVLHPHAHIVEKGYHRALIDFGGFRHWVPHCGYKSLKWEEGVRVDPLVFRHISRGH